MLGRGDFLKQQNFLRDAGAVQTRTNCWSAHEDWLVYPDLSCTAMSCFLTERRRLKTSAQVYPWTLVQRKAPTLLPSEQSHSFRRTSGMLTLPESYPSDWTALFRKTRRGEIVCPQPGQIREFSKFDQQIAWSISVDARQKTSWWAEGNGARKETNLRLHDCYFNHRLK